MTDTLAPVKVALVDLDGQPFRIGFAGPSSVKASN